MISIFNFFFCASVLVYVEQVSCHNHVWPDNIPDGPGHPLIWKMFNVIAGQYVKVHSDGNVTAYGDASGKDLSIQPSIISKHT